MVLLALAGLVASQLLLARYWIDLVDEGYFVDLADRVSRGELPYRDFATPYTPALHYLHAWAFGLLGRDLFAPRLVLIVVKAGLALLLYLLGRRLAPPAFAVLPVLLLFGIDTAPIMWEPHPAWYALFFALLCVWSICRLIEGGPDRWLIFAGAAAGLSFAFKQNIGLFIVLAATAFLLFHPSDLPRGQARAPLSRLLGPPQAGWLWPFVRVPYVLAVLGALTWLLLPYLEPRLAVVFLLPMFTLAVAGLAGLVRGAEETDALPATVRRLAWLGGGFLATTLVWLGPLTVALGPGNLPVAQFVGALDLASFYFELAEPRLGFVLFMFAAIVCPLAVQRLCRPAPFPRRLLEGATFMLTAVLATDLALTDIALATPDLPADRADLWHLSIRAAETVLLYLPSIAFWGGVVAYVSPGRTLTPKSALTLRWYLLAGALLLFNLYPRMDTMHVTFSGPLLFVVGAYALYRLFRAIERRLPDSAGRLVYRGLLFTALLVLPAAAALPNVEWRIDTWARGKEDGGHFATPDIVSLDVPGADVLVPSNTRWAIGGTAHYLRERTAPGEPIFVYPTLPMFYYLADRPNPTRFGHAYPGVATPAEVEEMIATLEARRVRYLVWDQFWVNEWGLGDRHLLNKPLTDYLLATYQTEVSIGSYHILARRE